MQQLEILLPTAVDHGFDYLVPEGMAVSPGDIVSVPFGRRESLGVVWKKGEAKISAGKLKPILHRHESFPPLSQDMRDFLSWAAWYNCVPLGAMLKMTLPIADIEKEGRKKEAAETFPIVIPAKLSLAQEEAAASLVNAIGKGFSVTLLDGVTGSGKTEVYFKAIEEALGETGNCKLEKDKSNFQTPDSFPQILVLLPEIGLSVQWIERFEKRFGYAPVVWNSEITPVQKRKNWRKIAGGEARVVVGARSALFLPYKNLSLIVVDEEHDQSYKQEEIVIYHARDMAVARARLEKFPVVLVSATPSLESYYNVRTSKYREVSLPKRHGGAEMPETQVIDMRVAPLERGAFISEPLRQALAQAIANGHQAMLFLNRRGYAPLLLCRHCGHRFECPDCSSWLVVHRKGRHSVAHAKHESTGSHTLEKDPALPPRVPQDDNSYLQCHHCDHREPFPTACPACGKDELAACGPGVERVHEEAKDILPQARIAVMASDQLGGGDLAKTISAMEKREIDLLIGTQMIAKGHHFAGLAVVGVVDADLGLAGGDLRAAERTYQLLHQLSGRAGREDVPGKVFLQTFLPEHPVMKTLIKGDRDAFLAAELEARKTAHMPPFSRLAAVIIEGTKEELVMKTARQLAASFPTHPTTITLLGPAPAPLYRLRGKFRYRLLVRADRTINLPDFMRAWLANAEHPSSLRIKTDIDPVSFL